MSFNLENPQILTLRGSVAVPPALVVDGQAMKAWSDTHGAIQAGLVDATGTTAMDPVNHAVRVNVVAGGGGGASNVTIVSPIGQQLMATSVAVVIASNQTAIPVSGTVSIGVPLGQATMAASLPVVIASNQSAVPVSSATLATEATLATMLTLSGFQARINTLGQKAMAASTPIVIASDQSAIPVSGTVSIGVPLGQATMAASLPVVIASNQSAVPVSSTTLATEATLATMLTLAGFQARINTLGSKTSANSTPVVIASDQAAVATKETRSSAAAPSSVGASVTSVTLIAANANRLGGSVFNNSSSLLYVATDTAASAADATLVLLTNGYWEVPFGYTGVVSGIWVSAVGNAFVAEYT